MEEGETNLTFDVCATQQLEGAYVNLWERRRHEIREPPLRDEGPFFTVTFLARRVKRTD
jgi:hypothetical protein